MAYSNSSSNRSFNPNPRDLSKNHEDGDDDDKAEAEKLYETAIQNLERDKGWVTEQVFHYQGTWLSKGTLKSVLLFQQQFKALPDDILFLATFPKSGTTWFKALIYTIINRNIFTVSSHPLLDHNPHDNFPFLEVLISQNQFSKLNNPNLSPSPRLLATHIPYPLLSKSLSGNRIVYVARDPKDVLVSFWHYARNLRPKLFPSSTPSSFSLQEAYDQFRKGVVHTGPYWDHVLGYWKASLESPENVLFLTYESMKEEPLVCIKRLAEFLGRGFSEEEEKAGVLDGILRFCSFGNLSELEINKNGVQEFGSGFEVPNRCFFREGEIGGWKKWLTDEMVMCLDDITKHKFDGSGLGSSQYAKV